MADGSAGVEEEDDAATGDGRSMERDQLDLLQQYFSANEQCFPLITNQHKSNFSETNKVYVIDVYSSFNSAKEL